ncbi:MAG: hypothetical protein Q4E65_01780 [Clostridia bacterium]|nr:hypothetical protein [Clostridia bacterium]
MKAIVYTSNSGFTKAYAQMLGEKAGLPVYTLPQAKEKLQNGDDILYMGWMFAGSVKDYQKAAKLYSVKALLPVGMAPDGQNSMDELRQREKLAPDTPIFYLQGGYAPEKLHGIYKLMMSMMARVTTKQMKAKENKTPEDEAAIKMFHDGCDFVSADNLNPVLSWLSSAQ